MPPIYIPKRLTYLFCIIYYLRFPLFLTLPVIQFSLQKVAINQFIYLFIYWGPHLSPQPTCMLFLLYHLWYYLNYRDINQLSHKGGGGGGWVGVTGPPGPPPSYAPDEEKKISPSLVYVLNRTWNLAFSCPSRAVMAKKLYKKA